MSNLTSYAYIPPIPVPRINFAKETSSVICKEGRKKGSESLKRDCGNCEKEKWTGTKETGMKRI